MKYRKLFYGLALLGASLSFTGCADEDITGGISDDGKSISYGVSLVGRERQRQITEEGYSFEHDDQEDSHQLSDAAAVYACHASARHSLLHLWPWSKGYFKPDKDNTIDGRIRELTKAGALVCAEIDRLVRLKKGTRK